MRLDLDRGRERIRPADDRSWLRFLLAVIDYAAWAADGSNDADQILSDCRREVAELGHLSVSESESFDRLEYLLQASAGWARLQAGTLPPELLNLLPAAWVRPFTEIRPALAGLLGEIAAAPENWLWHLDVVAARNPAALSFLGSLLGQYEVRLSAPPPVPHLPADLARLVAEMLHDAGQWVYASFRPRLLEFCLREAIGAELVAAVAPATSAGNCAAAGHSRRLAAALRLLGLPLGVGGVMKPGSGCRLAELQITRLQAGMFGEACEHPRADFVVVMEGENDIWPTGALKDFVRPRLPFHSPSLSQ